MLVGPIRLWPLYKGFQLKLFKTNRQEFWLEISASYPVLRRFAPSPFFFVRGSLLPVGYWKIARRLSWIVWLKADNCTGLMAAMRKTRRAPPADASQITTADEWNVSAELPPRRRSSVLCHKYVMQTSHFSTLVTRALIMHSFIFFTLFYYFSFFKCIACTGCLLRPACP